MKKIILKNFKYNLKKYILFFLCNVFATIEITAFLGFKSIVKKAIKDSSIMFSMYVDFKLAEKNYNNYYCNDDGICDVIVFRIKCK